MLESICSRNMYLSRNLLIRSHRIKLILVLKNYILEVAPWSFGHYTKSPTSVFQKHIIFSGSYLHSSRLFLSYLFFALLVRGFEPITTSTAKHCTLRIDLVCEVFNHDGIVNSLEVPKEMFSKVDQSSRITTQIHQTSTRSKQRTRHLIISRSSLFVTNSSPRVTRAENMAVKWKNSWLENSPELYKKPKCLRWMIYPL